MEHERFNFESRESNENITSSVELRFFRHGDKESNKEKTDEEVELTEKGRAQAVGKSKDDDISQSIAFGSPKKRVQETVGLVMGGQLKEITGDETLEELKEKLDRELKIGSKIGVEERLDFHVDSSTDFGMRANEAFGKRQWLKFLVDESDALAQGLHDTKAETYSFYASNIAELVKKYLSVAKNWDRLVQDESKNYEDTLKRLFGTHQGVAESFLAKIIEQTKGKDERDTFVRVLNNQGFDFVEGFEIEIDTVNGQEQKIRISFKKEKDGETLYEYDEVVPHEVIDNLVLEQDE